MCGQGQVFRGSDSGLTCCTSVRNRIRPRSIAGRGGVSWCHLLSLHLPLPSGEGRGEGKLGLRYNGRSRPSYGFCVVVTSVVTTPSKPLRGQSGEVDFVIYPAISH